MGSYINNGGPAFSRPASTNPYENNADSQTGMSLRQYYAAHAPEIPDWFVPEGVEWQDITELHPLVGEESPEEYRKALDQVISNNAFYERQRYWQWRWYYADTMIKTEGGAA